MTRFCICESEAYSVARVKTKMRYSKCYSSVKSLLLRERQQPSNGDPSATSFPAPKDSGLIPRDCTLVITRKDGGIIGS